MRWMGMLVGWLAVGFVGGSAARAAVITSGTYTGTAGNDITSEGGAGYGGTGYPIFQSSNSISGGAFTGGRGGNSVGGTGTNLNLGGPGGDAVSVDNPGTTLAITGGAFTGGRADRPAPGITTSPAMAARPLPSETTRWRRIPAAALPRAREACPAAMRASSSSFPTVADSRSTAPSSAAREPSPAAGAPSSARWRAKLACHVLLFRHRRNDRARDCPRARIDRPDARGDSAANPPPPIRQVRRYCGDHGSFAKKSET